MTDTPTLPPAEALRSLAPDEFEQLLLSVLGPEVNPAIWDTLTEASVIARTKECLTGIIADLNNQFNQAKTDLEIYHDKCHQMPGPEGKKAWFDALRVDNEWRNRTIGFRRLVDRRLSLVKSRAAMTTTTSREQVQHSQFEALEKVARAISAHQDEVLSDVEGADEGLWSVLKTVTVLTSAGAELPLESWLLDLDARRSA